MNCFMGVRRLPVLGQPSGLKKKKIRSSQAGFVLVASLWMIAILLIMAAAFDSYTGGKLNQAIRTKQRLQDQLDRKSTEQTLRYLFATQRLTYSGLTTRSQPRNEYITDEGHVLLNRIGGEIRMDGTVYSGIGNVLFTINDQAGLLSLNSVTNYHLGRVLESFENDRLERQSLLNRLSDYRDPDDFLRLNGAEKREYQQLGMKPPDNDYLRSPLELHNVLGWSNWLDQHQEFDYKRWCSIRILSSINPNTMPAALFRNFPGITAEIADRLLTVRTTEPFRSVSDLIRRSGGFLSMQEEYYIFLPSQRVRISLFNRDSRHVTVIALQFTPLGLLGPWHVGYQYVAEQAIEIDESEVTQAPGELFSSRYSTVQKRG